MRSFFSSPCYIIPLFSGICKFRDTSINKFLENKSIINQILGTGIGSDYPHLADLLKTETKTTELLRIMSTEEWDCLLKNNFVFTEYEFAMEQKWFAVTYEHVMKWGEIFYPKGNGNIIAMTVPVKALEYMFYIKFLDGIGPAYSADITMLNIISKEVKLHEQNC